jgi:hypothetical protein
MHRALLAFLFPLVLLFVAVRGQAEKVSSPSVAPVEPLTTGRFSTVGERNVDLISLEEMVVPKLSTRISSQAMNSKSVRSPN